MRRFWNAPHMAEREGLKAVQMFEAIARGEIKALWVMATNPAVSLPRAGAMREALRKLELFVVSENVLSNDTVNAGAHVLLPAAAWGEKDGTVTNSERRISRQRAFLPLPGEAKPDWWIVSRGRAASRLCASVRLSHRRGYFPRACRAVGLRERRHARFRHRRARGDRPTRTTTRSSRCSGRSAANDASRSARFFADGGFFTPTARRASSRRSRPRCSEKTTARLSPAPQHRPHPRPVAHHDAHRPEPAARRAPAGTVRRGASGRRHALRPRRWRLRARRQPPRRLHPQGRDQRRPAARLALRADPLERQHRLVRARRRSGRAADRSVLRPAGGEGDAGLDRAGRLRLSRLCARARAVRAAGRNLVDAGGAARHHGLPVRQQRQPRTRWRSLAPSLFPDAALPNSSTASADSIARRPSSTAASKARCSSAPPTRRRNGATCGRWSAVPASPRPGRSSAPASASASPPSARPSRRATPRASRTIGKALRAGTNCGSCLPELRSIVSHELASQNAKDRVNDRHTHDHAHAR